MAEDMYAGYNDYNEALDVQNLQNDSGFQNAVATSHGRRPPATGFRRGRVAGNVVPPTPKGRLGTAAQDGGARPMTAVQSAGFNSSSMGYKTGPAPSLEIRDDNTPEEKIRALERKVNKLCEESCVASNGRQRQVALDKAKEAAKIERLLVRQREQQSNNLEQTTNHDLTYSVLFNLAAQYAENEMYQESINSYQVIIKNKVFTNSGRLKVNVGNIYFKQNDYARAIKNYRMALDQVPSTYKNLRIKIMQNIGIAFVKLGQYSDAVTSFEHVMQEQPDFRTGFNLIICYFLLGDQDQMKKAFEKLLTVNLNIEPEDKYTADKDDKQSNFIAEAIKNDAMRRIERERRTQAERSIKMAAKIISPAIDKTFSEGYNWCMDRVKNSSFVFDLAHDLEIDKAIGYLKQKNFPQAIETLKSFERKDTKVACAAATNLSFVYFLTAVQEENELKNADKYAEIALQSDRYNPAALVNKGNILFIRKDYEKARECYQEALHADSSCVEACYNLGLCSKRLKKYDVALECFRKLQLIIRNSAQIIYQIADILDLFGDRIQAIEWFMQLIALVPSDAGVQQRLGEMYDEEGDKSQAYQCYFDSYRYNPCNISVIEWLGAYFIEQQFAEKAIHFFERAAIIQPGEVKWQLMVASCHRRSGNYQLAFNVYKQIHRRFPENIECLKFLVRLSSDLGLAEKEDFSKKLAAAEKMLKVREERVNSASSNRRKNHTDYDELAVHRTSSAGRRNQREKKAVDFDNVAEEPYQVSNQKEIDTTYSDPIGPQAERPKTAARRRDAHPSDEFGEEELGDDLLPE